jgi:hypothetical protein
MGGQVDLNSLGDTLQRQYAAIEPALAVRVSNSGRLLTVLPATSEVTARSETRLKKSTRPVPKGKAFELYVTLEGPSAGVDDPRIAPPAEVDATLALEEGRRVQMWTLAGPGGDRIVVRLRLGDDMDGDEARRLLQTIERAIAP